MATKSIGNMTRTAGGAVIALALVTAGAGPAAASPTVVIRPSTGLADGQTVTVELSGMPEFETMLVVQCDADVTRCNVATLRVLSVDATGQGTTTMTVAASTDLRECAEAPGTCVIAVYSARTGWVTAPLQFGAALPPEVTVDDRATMDPKSKVVTVTGTVDCHGAFASASVAVTQDRPARATGANVALCTGEHGVRPWSVTLPGPSPPFVPGHEAHFTVSLALDGDPSTPVATATAVGVVANRR